MKTFIYISLFAIFGQTINADKFTSDVRLQLIRNIEMSLKWDFLDQGKNLPTSFEEMPTLSEIAANNPTMLAVVNTMTLVPGAPKVEQAPGIQREHHDWRIFAIGRKAVSDFSPQQDESGRAIEGRYSVWITADGKYAAPAWIPESESQAILKQIRGFDPAAQPLAFADSIAEMQEKKEREAKLRKEISEDTKETRKGKSKDQPSDQNGNSADKPHGLLLFSLGVAALALIAWLAVSLRRRNAHDP